MQITVNGQLKQTDEELSIAQLIEEHQLQPLRVAVEVNEQLIRRRHFDSTLLRPGDHVEIVTFVGGG